MSSIDDQLSKIYYDPARGFQSANHLWQQLRSLRPKPTLKYVQEWIKKQTSHSIFTQRHVKTYFPIRLNRSVPFERCQMDIMFMAPEKTKCIFVFIDTYTRYLIAVDMKHKDSNSVIAAFDAAMNQVMALNELPPLQIDCDGEAAFKGEKKALVSVLPKYGMTRDTLNLNLNAGVENHKALAFVDRVIRTLRILLNRVRNAQNETNWSGFLSQVVENYNHTIHSSTQQTPYDMVTDIHGLEHPETYSRPTRRGETPRVDTVSLSFPEVNEHEPRRMDRQEQKAAQQPWYKEDIAIGDTVRIPVRLKKGQEKFYKKTKPKWSSTVETVTDIVGGSYYYVTHYPNTKYRKYELLKVHGNESQPQVPAEVPAGAVWQQLDQQARENRNQLELNRLENPEGWHHRAAHPNLNAPRETRSRQAGTGMGLLSLHNSTHPSTALTPLFTMPQNTYCLKCKTHTEDKNHCVATTKNGRGMLKSTCGSCGGKKNKFISNKCGGSVVNGFTPTQGGSVGFAPWAPNSGIPGASSGY